MTRPRILIPVPTSFDEPYNAKSWPEYASAVQAAGGEAVRLLLTHSIPELERLVAEVDGILLPGSGADVDPSRYGHDRNPATAEADDYREQTDRALFEIAERSKTPLLGICFGTQSMNVFYGGTLIQDLDPVPVNHSAGRAVQVAHAAVLAQNSRLGKVLAAAADSTARDGEFYRLPMNSSHHQAISAPGDSLRVVARCPDDGVIEAVEGSDPEHWLVGVQWHPERTRETSAASVALFQAFLSAASR